MYFICDRFYGKECNVWMFLDKNQYFGCTDGAKMLKMTQNGLISPFLRCSYSQNIDFRPKTFIHSILYYTICHIYSIYDIKLIFDEENQLFRFGGFFLWSSIEFPLNFHWILIIIWHRLPIAQKFWKKSENSIS